MTSEARVGLIDSGPVPPARPSADLLLATLAATCGPRALAVVLTGLGHDGQAGVRAIVHCGGTFLVQDEATAAFQPAPRRGDQRIGVLHQRHRGTLRWIGASPRR